MPSTKVSQIMIFFASDESSRVVRAFVVRMDKYMRLMTAYTSRVGVIKIVIVINCNLIIFSKVISYNCN